MVAKNARDVLQKENELLDELVKSASAFAKNARDVDADIANAWVNYFRRHRAVNEELINSDNPDFDQELTEEVGLLESMRDSIASGGLIEKTWKDGHGDDIAIAKKLL